MIAITDTESAAQAKYALELALLQAPTWAFSKDESQAATQFVLNADNFELSVRWNKLIFAWWDEQHSQSWHIVGYQIQPGAIHLRATQSFGRNLTTLRLHNSTPSEETTEDESFSLEQQRQFFREKLPFLLSQRFAQARIKLLPGLVRSRTGSYRYSRMRMEQGHEISLVIAVCATETQADINEIVAAGLCWLAQFNQTAKPQRTAQRLIFCLPEKRGQTVLERLSLLTPFPFGARLECFEFDEKITGLTWRTLATQVELLNQHTRDLRWPVPLTQANHWRDRILKLAPDLIVTRPQPHGVGETFSIHGLEFARTANLQLGRFSFGVAGLPDHCRLPTQPTLNNANFTQLEALVQQIIYYRNPQPPNRQHPLYRLRPEAWLESLLRHEVRALDATLDERYCYAQIPAWCADERSVLDLLSVNQAGRLVVIEIKAVEDLQLPFQGLDYWLRVEQARLRGELTQRGLFPGLTLANQPPLLYLVAPHLRFHRAFTTLAGCITSEVETYRFGLNSNWRARLRVHSRERVNSLKE